MEQKSDKKNFLKRFMGDSVWSILALCIMNVAMQMLAYPALERQFGEERYGEILYLIGIVNIIAVSFGSSANNARLLASVNKTTHNSVYKRYLYAVYILSSIVSLLVMVFSGEQLTPVQYVLYWLLMCATVTRYYADVEYRLNMNYKGYFMYYLSIACGYCIGAFLVKKTGLWQLALLPGEFAGLLYVFLFGNSFKKDESASCEQMKTLWNSVKYLISAQFLVNIVLNSDRLVLRAFCSGTDITLYYVASLVGKTATLIITPFNSVIIGYLVRTKKTIKASTFALLSAAGIVVILLLMPVFILGSHIFSALFYSDLVHAASPLFLWANLAQVIYFACGIYTTILLRYIQEKYQLIINILYIVVFGILAIPATWKFGLWGYVYGVFLANTFRYVLIGILGYFKLKRISVSESDKEKDK